VGNPSPDVTRLTMRDPTPAAGAPGRCRPARPEEASALRDLVRDAYARWVALIGSEPAPMNDDYAARIAAGQAHVLEDDRGGLLGVIVLEQAPDALLVDNVAIAEGQQGKGLGRVLMAFAEQEARRLGLDTLRLYTNAAMEANVRLYERLGYVETRRATEHGFHRVFMAKRLS
jgi:GNAT superfamily N-acetyltransferase